jgi:hypothetical protein
MMPETREMTLREGLKFMLTMSTVALTLSAKAASDEEFDALLGETADAFIKGLRKNGYEIVSVESPHQA